MRPDGAASGAFDVPRARGGSFSLVTIRGAWPYPAVILCIFRGVSRQSWAASGGRRAVRGDKYAPMVEILSVAARAVADRLRRAGLVEVHDALSF